MTKTTKIEVIDRREIDVAVLRPWAGNPRVIREDDPGIDELAHSLAMHGQLVPLVVRLDPDPLNEGPAGEVLAGNRRLAAMRQAGIKRCRVDVVDADSDELVIAVVENVERTQLSPVEEALTAERVLERLRGPRGRRKVTAEHVAAALGRPLRWTQRRLRLLALVPEARQALEGGALTLEAAEVLAGVPEARQADVLERARSWASEGAIAAYMIRRVASVGQSALRDAPFTLSVVYEGEGVRPVACSGCDVRTGAQAELWPDADAADLCLDPACYAGKARAAYEVMASAHPECVIEDDRALTDPYVSERVDLAASAWVAGHGWIEDEGGERLTWQAVIDASGVEVPQSARGLLRDPVAGGPVWTVPRTIAAKAFDAWRRTRGDEDAEEEGSAESESAYEKAQAERERRAEIGSRVEEAFERALFGAIGIPDRSPPTSHDLARDSTLAVARGGLLFAIEAVDALGYGDPVLERVLRANPDLEGVPRGEWSVEALTAVLRQLLVAAALEYDGDVAGLAEPARHGYEERSVALARRVIGDDEIDLPELAAEVVASVEGAEQLRSAQGLAGGIVCAARSAAPGGVAPEEGAPDGGDPLPEVDD